MGRRDPARLVDEARLGVPRLEIAPRVVDEVEHALAGPEVDPHPFGLERVVGAESRLVPGLSRGAEREAADAYYCKRATEIFESYLNAPRLYRTNDTGEREYLSEKEAAATIAETKARMNELCR